MIKPTGGPAFACASAHGHQDGMTLRDFFAAMALQGMLSHPDSIQDHHYEYAAASYKYADAMIANR